MNQNVRLQRLRVAVKLMLAFALLVCVYVIFSAFQSNDTTEFPVEVMEVDLTGVGPGQSRLIDWDSRPVLIVHRTADQIEQLAQAGVRLRDAESGSAQQPAFATPPNRSLKPEWLVVVATGTDFSCIVNPVDEVPENIAGMPGVSGLKDSCRGSYYDLAGRVFAGQYAEQNLLIPNYRWQELVLTLGIN